MFRSPYELDAHVRRQSERLASERERYAHIDRSSDRALDLATQVRRRVGISLMKVGAIVAGSEALSGPPTRPAWPELASR